ncbi:hypothetical protein P886_0614 [Alteromonadaceae bacterium 2753L.S.0a.02]|nr:hypothetical protein P886_0614 [Alteromonadaceae bacterium 2753L.S.0a.02]
MYWWDGSQLVDSQGRNANPDNGEVYGSNPLEPNEAAIKAFASFIGENHDRIKTQRGGGWEFDRVAGGYPDWFLFRRGETFTEFDNDLAGGRSRSQPMVVSAYGPKGDGRAIFDASGNNPFAGPTGSDPETDPYWFHQIVTSIEHHGRYGWVGAQDAVSEYDGQPITAILEDMYITGSTKGGVVYAPRETLVHKTIITNNEELGYFTGGTKAQTTLDTVIMFRNGFASDPLTDPDPVHDKFTRNIYQAGGAQLGHVYRNLISASGASGGPQMRFGAVMENSLILEGYFYCSTRSGSSGNAWLEANDQTGQSCIVRNSVQFPYKYPNVNDPDTYGLSDTDAHTGDGFAIQAATFGAEIQGNIISGAMMINELGGNLDDVRKGIRVTASPMEYKNGTTYTLKNNTISDNIVYMARAGIELEGDTTGAVNNVVENNTLVSDIPLSRRLSNANVDADEFVMRDNTLYTNSDAPSETWIQNNSYEPMGNASTQEGWTDPSRTLKRYVTEELGMALLDWADDPFLDPAEKQIRVDAGEEYDPTGMKTFMAVAEHMRLGGNIAAPSNGNKPSLTADYAWDDRFTALAVVNWVREGFGLDAVGE